MAANLSQEEQRRGTRRLVVSGAIAAAAVFVALMVWGFVLLPKGVPPALEPTAATGVLANQRAGESTAAKKDAITPETTKMGGAGQNSSAEAGQIEGTAGPLKLTSAQRQQIQSYFAANPPDHDVGSVDFALVIGAAVPKAVHLQKLPLRVSSAMEGFRGDDYIIVHHELVIVDPSARRVVALTPGVG